VGEIVRMSPRRPRWALPGTLAFLVLVPGTVAGLVPCWLTGWRPADIGAGTRLFRAAGACLVLVGLVSLLDSFARFVFEGMGTPAPVAAPSQLVVSGQYRYVRNPMYVAVLALVLGEGVALARPILLAYALLLWLIFHLFIVLYEEPALASRFGTAYGRYRRSVGRWLPRVSGKAR
jgi:protein-S-isoprenylcysteine O-methyltransferase Ste14